MNSKTKLYDDIDKWLSAEDNQQYVLNQMIKAGFDQQN